MPYPKKTFTHGQKTRFEYWAGSSLSLSSYIETSVFFAFREYAGGFGMAGLSNDHEYFLPDKVFEIGMTNIGALLGLDSDASYLLVAAHKAKTSMKHDYIIDNSESDTEVYEIDRFSVDSGRMSTVEVKADMGLPSIISMVLVQSTSVPPNEEVPAFIESCSNVAVLVKSIFSYG